MVSITFDVINVITQEQRGILECGFRFEGSKEKGKLFVYDNRNEWALSLRFLQCEDRKIIYVTHVVGEEYRGLNADPLRSITDVEDIDDDIMYSVLPEVFTGYIVLPFDQDEFDACKREVCERVTARATTLSHVFPYNMTRTILEGEIPKWCYYKHGNAPTTPFDSFQTINFMKNRFYPIQEDTRDETVTLSISYV